MSLVGKTVCIRQLTPLLTLAQCKPSDIPSESVIEDASTQPNIIEIPRATALSLAMLLEQY